MILCERGVRTFSDHSRNTLDLSVVPPAKALSHLPILVDPSHGTGKRDYVPPMAMAALAAGADGLAPRSSPRTRASLIRRRPVARFCGVWTTVDILAEVGRAVRADDQLMG